MTKHVPFCNFDEWMVLSKLQSEDTIPKVVPVNDNLDPLNATDEPDQRKGWDTGRVLTFNKSHIRQ